VSGGERLRSMSGSSYSTRRRRVMNDEGIPGDHGY